MVVPRPADDTGSLQSRSAGRWPDLGTGYASTVAFALPWGAEITVENLDAIVDDGHRYELLNGAMLVTPAPHAAHQVCAGALVTTLTLACGPQQLVLPAPFDYRIDDRTLLQPDVLVVRRSDIDRGRLTGTPLLVVEIQSPSTRLIDLNLKRATYAGAGVPGYWLVDPTKPSVTVLELEADAYVETAKAAGEVRLSISHPFPVTIVPQDLLQGLDA